MIRERDVETYLGIQRPLVPKRVQELEQYVRTVDACFPTAVILAVEARCARYDDQNRVLTLTNVVEPKEGEEKVFVRHIARVLDGQHRIAGLMGYEGLPFGVNVSIFIDIDIADQAYIFSTVNLAQTKVNRSLAYDLFDLAKSRSPQKTCHNIAVALDRVKSSPFHKRIKRLGVATEGRFGETLTQATVVQALLPYLSNTPVIDRDVYLRGKKPEKVGLTDSKKLIFRNMFIDEKDIQIGDVVMNYFSSVKDKWTEAWESNAKGAILSRTNGFRAFARFLRPAYLAVANPGQVPSEEAFTELWTKVALSDEDFTTENFDPGTSGESDLYKALVAQTELEV
jgi:DGQHR domain-containing protein